MSMGSPYFQDFMSLKRTTMLPLVLLMRHMDSRSAMDK